MDVDFSAAPGPLARLATEQADLIRQLDERNTRPAAALIGRFVLDYGVAAIDVPGVDARCWTHGAGELPHTVAPLADHPCDPDGGSGSVT